MTIHPSWCMAHAPKHTMPKTRSPKWSASALSMIQTRPQGNVADSSNKLNITRMWFQWICQWRIIWLCIVQLITNWQGWEGEGEARLTAKSHRTGANHGHRCQSWFHRPCQCRCRHHHRQWCRRKVNINVEYSWLITIWSPPSLFYVALVGQDKRQTQNYRVRSGYTGPREEIKLKKT